MRVAIVPLPRFNMTVLSCAIDVLRYAADDGDNSRQAYCQWDLVSTCDTKVISNSDVQIMLNKVDNFDDYDVVLLIGGAPCQWPEQMPHLAPALWQARLKGSILGGYCTGSFALVEAGIICEQPVAVHWRHQGDMKRLYPHIHIAYGQLYRIDNHIMTCAGGTAALDATIELVKIFLGERRAMKALPDLIVDKHRPQVMEVTEFDYLLQCGDDIIVQSMQIMCKNISTPLSTRDIADNIAVSARTLERRYKEIASTSPAGVYKKLRLNVARKALLNTAQSVITIAMDTGFADASHFSRSFFKEYDLLPSQYRKLYKNTDTKPGTFSVFSKLEHPLIKNN